MKLVLKALAIVVLAAIGAGSVLYLDGNCPEKKAKTEEQINNTIQAYLENNKESVAHLILSSEAYKNAAPVAQVQEAAQDEEISDEDKVFMDHWEELKNSKAAPFVGPENAKVTVVEFFDFACGHCRALAPVVAQLVKSNPDVKFVFNPLYFISEHSSYAAKAALAAAEKGKFMEVYEGIMTLPELNEEAINQILVDENLNVAEIKKLMEEKKIRRGSQDIDALSNVLGVNGVPMLIINGRPFYGRSLTDLQNYINYNK